MLRKNGRFLAKLYKLNVRSAYYHNEGNWYWNLTSFPGAYFDDFGVVVFETEQDYFGCVYLSIGLRNTGVRSKNVGISISDIPGYKKLEPSPRSF